MAICQLVQAACKRSMASKSVWQNALISRVCILFISFAVAEGGIFMSGLFIVVVLRGNTPYSLYTTHSFRAQT